MSEELKAFKVYLEPIDVKARNREEAKAFAQKFYQTKADGSYFSVDGPNEATEEPMIGPGCFYDISVENED